MFEDGAAPTEDAGKDAEEKAEGEKA